MASNNNGEPSSAPQPERWYELKLGSSFKDHSPSKFCTLRYEFKPASIDKSQPGSLHKSKENRVTVEFNNNQPGKPKVTFEGSSEDYKDNDAVLLFDGQTFRLERLHRAVKRLRHVRLPGESASAAASIAPATSVAAASIAPNTASAASALANVESRSPQIGKVSKSQPLNKPVAPPVHVEVERIDIGEPESPGIKPTNRSTNYTSAPPNTFFISPEPKHDDQEENIDIDVDDDDDEALPKMQPAAPYSGFDINIPTNNDTDEEIADVDVSDDEAGKGPNAAEALRAQVNAEEGQQQQQQQEDDEESSSSSGSSGSGSSDSGSGSGSSSSDSSDDDSASSAGDIDI